MRYSAGGCYLIAGTEVKRVMDGPPEAVTAARWRERQRDLWAESSTIIHLDHRLTLEEIRLLETMREELQAIEVAVARLEGTPPPSQRSESGGCRTQGA
jgi:hypothetical protein